ncbi:MAG TPA: MAE_28990/MAE_18760 family HEPN-like nuclease [Candidatus Sulfotelmatobacter sp.]|nr:MAE_28990/MAE_18760 family HEPN-like nuclease [Candidatus Sulfotelmatobacter sp.]
MAAFEDRICEYCDARVSTLGKIKAKSLGADALTLTALKVLVYAQLEGGIKDLSACVLRDLNNRGMTLGEIKPSILQWRNSNDIARFRSMVNFEMIAMTSPFSTALAKQLRIRGINRKREMNQMDWEGVKRVYTGFGLDYTAIESMKGKIDGIVEDRNEAAHYGGLSKRLNTLLEQELRENAGVVEHVLNDLSLQLLPYFTNLSHRR